MNDKHLAESEIQEFVLDESSAGPALVSHMRTCPACQAKAAAYGMLFTGMAGQAKPAFDFDLSAAVLTKISAKNNSAQVVPGRLPPYGILFSILAAVAAAGWTYKTTLIALYRTYILGIVAGVSKMVILCMVITVCCFLIFQLAEMYKRYQRKMDGLNIY
jgi:hypothetical protein